MVIPGIAIPEGGWINSPTVTLWNRTGANTKRGGAYLLDLNATQPESTTYLKALSNVTPVTTASIFKQYVIANEIIADNALGQFFAPVGDANLCMVLVDGSGTNIAIGDPLKGVNASDSMVKATAASDGTVAFALGTSTATGSLIPALTYGRAVRQG